MEVEGGSADEDGSGSVTERLARCGVMEGTRELPDGVRSAGSDAGVGGGNLKSNVWREVLEEVSR